MKPEIQKYFAEMVDEKRRLMMQVRDIFLSVDEKIEEAIKWRQLTFMYKGDLAFIYSYPKSEYVNLGFMKAVQLSDPKDLFEGTGKGMRHIKLYTEKDIKATQIKKWVKEAMKVNEAQKQVKVSKSRMSEKRK